MLTPSLHGGDLDARFRILVQSPLRAGLLRLVNTRPDETFDLEALMATTGRMRLDVNYLKELVDFGVVRRIVSGSQVRYAAHRPEQTELARLLDTFLERQTSSTRRISPHRYSGSAK